MNREQAMKLAEAVLEACAKRWHRYGDRNDDVDLTAIVDEHVSQAGQQEPVGWFDVEMDNMYTASELADGAPGLIPLYTAPPFVAVPDDVIDAVSIALCKTWQLGQTYWQQADSEYVSQQNKSEATQAKFQQLVDDTRALLAAAPKQERG